DTNDKVLGHTEASFLTSKASTAHERTAFTGVRTINAVGVFSIARRKRNHHVEITRRTILGATSQRFKATEPNPQPCKIRSTALKACSRRWPQRTHSKRLKSTPALAAEERSNVSLQSTSAQVSSCEVAAANTESMRLVRPEEDCPWISVIAPRGNPCKALSIVLMPVGRLSAGNRSYRSKMWPKRSASDNSICFLVTAAFMI